MRIIAGTARSRVIRAPEGKDTRPTLDRVRENLFNVLQNRVPYSNVLDLFGGSGALSLEAVSRGAKSAVCVDCDSRAVQCIRSNVKTLRFEENVRVLHADWKSAVNQLALSGEKFDLIFLDPPYAMHDMGEVTQAIKPLLADDCRVIIEHERQTMPNVAEGYTMVDQRRYGIVGISIFSIDSEAE